ncbi:hypothetical protein RJ55_07273 [Drechmeria coniospora]|nr:hypothetical protein RJ55_07273 [Drechmeria coniospora]
MFSSHQPNSQLRPLTVTVQHVDVARDTCGWVSGNPASPLTCRPGQSCGVDRVNSVVGCCWSPTRGRCHVSTTCRDKYHGKLDGSIRDSDLVWCANGKLSLAVRSVWMLYGDVAPYCKTNIFADDENLTGFSLFVCGADRITETILRYTTAPATSRDTIPVNTLTASTPTETEPMSPPRLTNAAPPPPLATSLSPSSTSPPAWGVASTVLGSLGWSNLWHEPVSPRGADNWARHHSRCSGAFDCEHMAVPQMEKEPEGYNPAAQAWRSEAATAGALGQARVTLAISHTGRHADRNAGWNADGPE